MPQSKVYSSTDMVEAKYRNDFWSAITSPILESSLVEDQEDEVFRGTVEARPLGSLAIGASSFNAQKYLRTQKHIARSDLDHYMLQLVTSGSECGDFDGNIISVRSGDISIVDSLRPMKSQVTSGSTLTVMIPRSLIDGNIKGKLHGVVLQSEAPTTRLLTNCIQSLYALEDPLEFGTSAQIENAFAALVAAGVSTSSSWNESDVSQLSKILRERILNFIDMNLENTDLNVAMLMQQFQVSRAHIYRAFSEDGGVAKIIRERRLDAAFAALINPKLPNRSLEEIAYRFGVVNYSQFSRAFRARFGATPGCVRSDKISLGALFELSPKVGEVIFQCGHRIVCIECRYFQRRPLIGTAQ